MSNSTLYERDFYAWANEQAGLLRNGKLAQADIANIAEEIESMGRSEKRELVNRLCVLLSHLLKWEHQADKRSGSWRRTINVQRSRLIRHLAENPSLKATLDQSVADAHHDAVEDAIIETSLDPATFPVNCAWSFEQIVADDFWPGDASEP